MCRALPRSGGARAGRRGRAPALLFGLSETPIREHPRIYLDLYAGDAVDQAAEVERLVSVGAQRVDWDLSSTTAQSQ